MRKEDTPCYECPKRYAGCHSKCPDYKRFKSKCDEIRKNRKNDKTLVGYKLEVFKNYRKNRNLDGK